MIFWIPVTLILWVASIIKAQSDFLPVVLWHGMGDTCCYPFSMGHVKNLIQQQHNGTYVYSIMIGDSIISDAEQAFLGNANDQVAEVCDKLQADPELVNGYHAIGFSQGGQFLRAVAQRCPSPPMVNFTINESYKQNLLALENLILVLFLQDITVIPRESSWFGFYKPGQDIELQTLQESVLYTEDRLGLKALDEAGKLHFLTCDGAHMQFTDEWFIETILPFLT
ncbi:palmitoyl-protein thioesterase 1-like [Hyalella azteca]|uniref:Palmitoyl-protein thioesterase 1 n=1 Tax=Hyalella azteca TaxID=294128 RepID=A0A8B7NQ55_HYAAZ|nr:palmitoyl-protein thioesterase 1-like [Hyalella azteca]